MKHVVKSFLFFLTLGLVLAGCETTDTNGGAPVESRDTSDTRVVTVQPSSGETGNLPPELRDPNNILSKRSVYFDLDRYNVADQYRALINAHAAFLVSHRQLKVQIQGNTDERGSREYNLSLGQKRAEAVRQLLLLLGAREDQIEAVSFGEEKPRAEGSNEEAWAENRRADIYYVGE
jgi:peptidoglycan-associated lipoprotein